MRLVGISYRLYALTIYATAALYFGCHEGDCYGTRGDPCSALSDCRDPYVCEDDYCRETCTVKKNDCYYGLCIPSEIAKSGGVCKNDDEGTNDAGDISQAGTGGGGNGNDQSDCFWVCDQAAMSCTGLCMSYFNVDTKEKCDSQCTQNKDSCHERCPKGIDAIVNGLIQCQATCSNSGATCNAVCLTRIDPAAIEDCENTCIEDMKSCAEQC